MLSGGLSVISPSGVQGLLGIVVRKRQQRLWVHSSQKALRTYWGVLGPDLETQGRAVPMKRWYGWTGR